MQTTLYHGDCLDILPTLPDQSVDAIITDPPYGVTSCRWDSVIPFEPMWAQLKRIIKPRGAIVLFGKMPFTSALVMSNPKMFRYEWVWQKDYAANFSGASYAPLQYHEMILVFSASRHVYNPQMGQAARPSNKRGGIGGTPSIGGARRLESIPTYCRYPSSILSFYVPKHNSDEGRVHPTQKPVALLEYLIRTYTNEGETVLDFAFGSGTTGVACVNTGRSFIGIEKDAHYFAVAEQRIAEAQAAPRQLELAS